MSRKTPVEAAEEVVLLAALNVTMEHYRSVIDWIAELPPVAWRLVQLLDETHPDAVDELVDWLERVPHFGGVA